MNVCGKKLKAFNFKLHVIYIEFCRFYNFNFLVVKFLILAIKKMTLILYILNIHLTMYLTNENGINLLLWDVKEYKKTNHITCILSIITVFLQNIWNQKSIYKTSLFVRKTDEMKIDLIAFMFHVYLGFIVYPNF